jgi:hypothetical protein
MRWSTRFCLLICTITVFLAGVTFAQVPVSDDVYVSAASPDRNFNAGTSAYVLAVQGPGTETFIRFDLSGLPSGLTNSTVSKASLRLFLTGIGTSGTFSIYLVTGPWSESTVTFNTVPPIGTAIATGIPTSSVDSFVMVDITTAFQEWVSGTPNYGIAIVPDDGISCTFESKESTRTSHQPELQIVLNGPAGPQGVPGSLGPQGPVGPQGPSGPPGPGVSLKTANTFAGSQTILGTLTVGSPGSPQEIVLPANGVSGQTMAVNPGYYGQPAICFDANCKTTLGRDTGGAMLFLLDRSGPNGTSTTGECFDIYNSNDGRGDEELGQMCWANNFFDVGPVASGNGNYRPMRLQGAGLVFTTGTTATNALDTWQINASPDHAFLPIGSYNIGSAEHAVSHLFVQNITQAVPSSCTAGTISVSSSTSGSTTFAGSCAFSNPPVCTITPTSDPTSVGSYWVTSTRTSVTAYLHTSGTIRFDYACVGNPI